jgi:hypothetical protein
VFDRARGRSRPGVRKSGRSTGCACVGRPRGGMSRKTPGKETAGILSRMRSRRRSRRSADAFACCSRLHGLPSDHHPVVFANGAILGEERDIRRFDRSSPSPTLNGSSTRPHTTRRHADASGVAVAAHLRQHSS